MRVTFPSAFNSRDFSAIVGAIAWLAFISSRQPSPFDLGWSHALLLLAPLILVPLALRCLYWRYAGSFVWKTARMLKLPAALLLMWSFLTPQGSLAAMLSLPWLATTGMLAVIGVRGAWQRRRGPVADLCLDIAPIYLAVGAFWTMLDRWGQRPLDFESVIVLLTGIHFHYAGFVLTALAASAIRMLPGRWPAVAGLGAIIAVPLTAVGITASQLGRGPLLETLAAWFMAASGLLIGGLYCRLGLRRDTPAAARIAFIVAGLSLLAGMVLAGLYGSRFFLSVPWLDIPWMRALHGSLNAFGFSLAGIVGWHFDCSIEQSTTSSGPRATDNGRT